MTPRRPQLLPRFLAAAGVTLVLAAHGGYVDAVKTNAPVAYWRLAEQTPPPVSSTAINRGTEGASLNGTYLGGVALGQPSAIAGDSDPSALFSPLSGQYLEIANHPSLNDAFTVTVELWAQVTGGSGPRCVASSLQLIGENRYGYALYVSDTGEWQFRTGRGSLTTGFNVVTGPTAVIGAWTHLVGVYDGTGLTAVNHLYVNGQWVGTVNGRAEMNQSNPQRIGASSGPFAATVEFFQGGIDEVAIYRRALPGTEIGSHYSAGTGYAARVFNSQPRGYWRLNELPPAPPTTAANEGTLGTAADGKYLNGTRGGLPGALVTDPANAAAGFDGTDDKIEAPFLPALNADTFTVECWASPPLGSPGPAEAVSSRDTGTSIGTRGWALGKDALDRWRLWLGTGRTDPAVLVGPNVRNQWQHLVGSYDGRLARLYVDATLVDVRRTNFLANAARPVRLGAGGNELPLGTAFFQGDLDEVAIYTNALPDGQVLEHFRASGRPAPTPVGPTIIENPESRTNYAGETVGFSVSAAGSLPLSYQWRRDDVDLAGATSATLILTNVTLADAGRYRARVFNSVNSALTFEARLTVEPEGLPVILDPPKPLTNYVGGTARFRVEATGGTNLVYQWQRNGVSLTGATNAALTLANVQLAHLGAYRVQVSTSRGTTFSDTAQLMVLAPPVGSYPAAVMANHPRAYWRLGEAGGLVAVDLAGGYHAEIVSNVGLRRPGALVGDPDTAYWFTADYRAWVQAPADLPQPTAALSVEAWAKLADASDTHRAVVGSLAANPARGFRLEVSPQGRWEFWLASPDGISVLTGPAAVRGAWTHVAGVWDGTVQRLYVNGAEVGRRPTGFLPAVNWPIRIGADSLDGGAGIVGTAYFDGDVDEVAIYGNPLTAEAVTAHYGAGAGKVLAPAILEQPDSVAAFAGYTVAFAVLAYGSPPLAYQWQFNGADLARQTNAVLTLTNVVAGNTGSYRVQIRNTAGTATSDAVSLTLLTLPDKAYADAVRDAGAIAYWRLGETVGTTAADSGGAHPGTYVDGVVLGQPGVLLDDFAARFVRDGAMRVEVPFDRALNSASFSVEIWARVTGAAGQHRAPLTSRIDAPERGYALMAGSADTWQFWTGRGDLSGWDIVDGPPVELATWTHLVGTFDGTTKRIYVNGSLAGKSTGPFAANDRAPLRIGGDELTSPGTLAYFPGDLDEAAVYAQALSPAEILTHYGLITQVVEPPTLSIGRDGASVVITWTHGTLQATSVLAGPWTDVNGSSPLRVTPSFTERFYRVRQ